MQWVWLQFGASVVLVGALHLCVQPFREHFLLRLVICQWARYSLGSEYKRGHSSAGRALQWHCRGRRFDPAWLHHIFFLCPACDMKHYLLKTEPDCWSWDQQCAKKVEPWDGVRNFQAQKFMKGMVVGDLAFFYHTGSERRIMGVVRIVREAYPDPTDPEARFSCVDVETVCAFKNSVTLAQIKADERFDDFMLVKQARLSVMPVPEALWNIVCSWGGIRF